MNRSYLNDSLVGFEADIPFALVAAELAVDPAVVVVVVVVAVVVQSLPVADLAERIRPAVRSFGFAALAAEHPASGLTVVRILHLVVALPLVDHQASSCH